MVWPPPKVLATPEGEVTVERPQAGAERAEEVLAAPAAAGLPGATLSVMAATPAPRDWLARPEGLLGSVLGSRYRVTGVLGRGPMGIACEGESSRGRQVTLKLLPRAPALPVEHFAWQVRQALALAHFDHPNVTPFSDFGPLEDGSVFVSRARTPGVALRTIVRQGPLPLGRALDIARQVGAGLAAGHAQDIAHGRLKPENVIVQAGSGAGDAIKLVDYGMAGLQVDLRAVAPDEAEARRLALRTRVYLPAEVTGASPALDVYSLGVLLFEMIAGQPPFALDQQGQPTPQGPPLSFAECNPSLVVPASVGELVAALMHPRAAEHGLDAGRAVQMLEALLGRASGAPPDPVTTQIQTAPPPAVAERPNGSGLVQPPDIRAFTAPSAPLAWPSSPPPSQGPSYPPLPQGFSASTFPPPAIMASSAPPAGLGSGASRPPPPPSARRAAKVDAPFATPSFPPGPPPSEALDLDLELRPSFIGRIKRLFGKKPPGEL